jgi:hypothetical protein
VKPSEKVRQHWQEKKLPGDPFDLHAVLFLGTCERRGPEGKSMWVIGETHQLWTEHSVGLDEDGFNERNADADDPVEAFMEELAETLREKLL